MERVKLDTSKLKKIREMDERLLSYNVEMTEVTGGTFWKPYNKEQIEGTEEFPAVKDFSEFKNLMAMYEPIDLKNERLIALTKALGPAYMRVSGSWATRTYYDFDGKTGGVPPESFRAVLTKEQWDGVLEFSKKVGAKLQVSVANCEGVHNEDGTYNPEQAKLLFDYTKSKGVTIDSTEFMNEPNTMSTGGAPANNYTPADWARDQDIYFNFIKDNYPETRTVGPSSAGDRFTKKIGNSALFNMPQTPDIIKNCKVKPDVFSYHCYNGISERGANVIGGHWDEKDTLSEDYLAIVSDAANYYAKIRDEYAPGADMWVTESADAGLGGNTWASTYLDVIRYANELGSFSKITGGAIFHNTLTSSDYGLLSHKDHLPRPSYWLVYMWSQLVGHTVYDTKEEMREGVHFYANSRKDGKEGYTYTLINNSRNESTFVEVPAKAKCYTLSADTLRSKEVLLNGEPLRLVGDHGLPEIKGLDIETGELELKPATVTFLVV